MDISTIIGFISLLLVVMTQLCTMIWWMSKIQTTLTLLSDSMARMVDRMEAVDKVYARKEDLVRVEEGIKNIWDHHSKPHACPNKMIGGK